MKTLIIDNYDSFTFNLFQMVAAINGEHPVVVPNDQLSWEEFGRLDVDNVIISAGPGRPENEKDFGICSSIIKDGRLPLLGICLGLQGMGYLFGGRIVHAPEPVHGRVSPIHHDSTGIFAGLPQGFQAVRYHSLVLSRPVPDCLRVTAWTEDDLIMGLEHRDRPLWAVQFHPESVCTEYGEEILRNFCRLTQRSKPVSRPHTATTITSAPSANCSTVFTRRIPMKVTPEEAFSSLFGTSCPAFWLDSCGADVGPHRFSFMGAAEGTEGAWLSYAGAEHRLTIHSAGGERTITTSLFDYLQAELHRRRTSSPDLPFDFNGGFVGYLGYELKAETGGTAAHVSPHADAALIFADRLLAFDHAEGAIYLTCIQESDDPASAGRWFDETEERLRATARPDRPADLPTDETILFKLEQSRREYLASIDRCMQLIRDGESYEICLTNRLTASTTVDPLSYYCTLREINPAPQSAFLRFPDVSIACSSPESFLSIDPRGGVESKPIKGTLRRSPNEIEDWGLREMLRSSVKTRAENLMIVDLLRHDLGRVCETGSVHVPQMMQVHSYRNLHQLVSTIRGRLRTEATAVDCIRSAFPGGSMTGAPKTRTMELIDVLEHSARGIYSGSIGFLALNGAADLNIVIRTAVFSKGVVTIGVGGAIVALSDPVAEFDETILKSKALVDAFRPLITGEVKIEGDEQDTRRASNTSG